MSKVSAIYHIVFCTRSRKNTIPLALRKDIYRLISSYLRDVNCLLYRINGTENHIHMLINLCSSIALSQLMARIKANSSGFMKKSNLFPAFEGWSEGYYAATISFKHRKEVIDYIEKQEIHHLGKSFDTELKQMIEGSGMELCQGDLI